VALGAVVAVVWTTAAAPDRTRPGSGAAGPLTTLADPRIGETRTELPNGTVLVAGGQGLDGKSLASAELYDPRNGTWTPTGSIHMARWHHTATLLLDGKVLVAGGTRTGDAAASPEVYDPQTGIWTLTRPGHPSR
jgi:hypothetical protein